MLASVSVPKGVRRVLFEWVWTRVQAHYHLMRWKFHYEVVSLQAGIYVCIPKRDAPENIKNPPHWLCHACFESNIKSILNRRTNVDIFSSPTQDTLLTQAQWDCLNDANHFIVASGTPENYLLGDAFPPLVIPQVGKSILLISDNEEDES